MVISDDGKPLLCDFASSRMIIASKVVISPVSGAAGSCEYTAPELLAIDENFENTSPSLSKEADVWAFGMTTFVCGRIFL